MQNEHQTMNIDIGETSSLTTHTQSLLLWKSTYNLKANPQKCLTRERERERDRETEREREREREREVTTEQNRSFESNGFCGFIIPMETTRDGAISHRPSPCLPASLNCHCSLL